MASKISDIAYIKPGGTASEKNAKIQRKAENEIDVKLVPLTSYLRLLRLRANNGRSALTG